ncbi:MAG: YlxR family protein [Clostridiales Family XIII bacterium]|nr:YlxR family protein [Clostridiales Family XIII bacterium]
MRRCNGCMKSFPKKELLRLVVADDKVVVDPGGKTEGRGAYLCRSEDCLSKALKKKRFTNVMTRKLTEDEAEAVKAAIGVAEGRSEVSE